MSMPQDPRAPYRQQRWIEVINNSGETILPGSVMEVTSASQPDTGRTAERVVRPTKDGVANFLICGPVTIQSGGTGFGTNDFPVYARYNTSASPVNGDEWGPTKDSWVLSKGRNGVLIDGDATSVNGVDLVRVKRNDKLVLVEIKESEYLLSNESAQAYLLQPDGAGGWDRTDGSVEVTVFDSTGTASLWGGDLVWCEIKPGQSGRYEVVQNGMPRDPDIILIRNDSSGARDRFDVLAIDVPLVLPSVSEQQFNRRVAVSGITPAATTDGTTHVGQWAMLIEPAAEDAIVRAATGGTWSCVVDLKHPEQKWCDIAHESHVLTSNWYGRGQILWHEKWGEETFEAGEGSAIVHISNFHSEWLDGMVDEASGIAFDATGTVEIMWKGAVTDPLATVEAKYDWLQVGPSVIDDNGRVRIAYNREQHRWIIVQAIKSAAAFQAYGVGGFQSFGVDDGGGFAWGDPYRLDAYPESSVPWLKPSGVAGWTYNEGDREWTCVVPGWYDFDVAATVSAPHYLESTPTGVAETYCIELEINHLRGSSDGRIARSHVEPFGVYDNNYAGHISGVHARGWFLCEVGDKFWAHVKVVRRPDDSSSENHATLFDCKFIVQQIV